MILSVIQCISIFTLQRHSRQVLVLHGNSYRNWDWINRCFYYFRPDDVAGLERSRLHDLIDWIRLYRMLSDIVCTVLSLAFCAHPIVPPIGSFSHLVLRYFCSFFSPPLASTRMFFEVLEHDIFMADEARFGSGSTGIEMLHVLSLRPAIFTVLANHRFFRAIVFMNLSILRFYHLLAHGTFDLIMKLFLELLMFLHCGAKDLWYRSSCRIENTFECCGNNRLRAGRYDLLGIILGSCCRPALAILLAFAVRILNYYPRILKSITNI